MCELDGSGIYVKNSKGQKLTDRCSLCVLISNLLLESLSSLLLQVIMLPRPSHLLPASGTDSFTTNHLPALPASHGSVFSRGEQKKEH